MEGPSGARRRLRERAEEMRYSLRELSRLIERNATYLTQYVGKGSPRELTERDRQRLAYLLQMPAHALSDEAAAPLACPPMPATDGVPVLSAALGSGLARISAEQAVETVARPPMLAGVGNAFAIRIAGPSFLPAFQPGDLLFIHPNIPPLPGDLVCVTGLDGGIGLGRLGDGCLRSLRDGCDGMLEGTPEKVVLTAYR